MKNTFFISDIVPLPGSGMDVSVKKGMESTDGARPPYVVHLLFVFFKIWRLLWYRIKRSAADSGVF